MRQAPDDLVVHAGHVVAVVLHDPGGAEAGGEQGAEQAEQQQVAFAGVDFEETCAHTAGSRLQAAVADAEVETEVGAHLR